MKLTRLAHIFITGFTALFVFALLPQSGFAGQPVDPSTLNPPPPPQFNPVCESVGNGTMCTVQFSDPEALAKNRAAAPGCFPTLSDYQASFGDPQKFGAQSARFLTTSKYFRLSSLVTIGTAEFNLYSLLLMDGQGYFIHPIQRSFSPD